MATFKKIPCFPNIHIEMNNELTKYNIIPINSLSFKVNKICRFLNISTRKWQIFYYWIAFKFVDLPNSTKIN